jgi:hypothetical protein
MRNRVVRLLAILAVCTGLLSLAAPGFGQWRNPRYSRWDVERVLRQVEARSDRFAATVERDLGTDLVEARSDERLSMRARNLERQIDIVRQVFNEARDFRQIRPEVATVLNIARRVDNQMDRLNLDRASERQWMMLRANLNQLARVFDLPTV